MNIVLMLTFANFIIFGIAGEGNVSKSQKNATTPASSISDEDDSLSSRPIEEINAYLKKVCSGVPTCNLTDQLPQDFHTMPPRNCMCDSDCVVFGDCCLDSPFYNETQQRLAYGVFECKDVNNYIYVKNKCPPNFADTNIKMKCETWSEKVKSADTKFVKPVTNMATKVTYVNEYCALCNSDTNFVPWNVTYECQLPDYTLQYESSAKLDTESNIFYVDFNGTRAHCTQLRMPPLNSLLRSCKPMIWTCPSNADHVVADLCKIYTSVVMDKKFTTYKNPHCAACNGIKNTFHCRKAELKKKGMFSKAFSTDDKALGSVNPCAESTDITIREKFCS